MSLLRLPTMDEIEAARQRLAGHVLRTPLIPWGEPVHGAQVYLKAENLQPFGSFKLRAGLNALLSVPEEELQAGVVTASAGNFGQGIAAAAKRLGVKATVFAPDTAAQNKLDALRRLGAEIRMLSFDHWWNVMVERGHPSARGLFIHPVADNAVIAGNATIGLEIVEDLPEVDCIVVPFGGGGLISGIGAATKELGSSARIVGAETEAATPLGAALKAGKPVAVAHDRSTFVDGIGSGAVLDEMWPLLTEVVDGAVVASMLAVKAALRAMVLRTSLVAEGAGATALAAVQEGTLEGVEKIVCVVSGGNIDPAVLAEILNPSGASADPA